MILGIYPNITPYLQQRNNQPNHTIRKDIIKGIVVDNTAFGMKDIDMGDKARVLANLVSQLYDGIVENFKTGSQKFAKKLSSPGCVVTPPIETNPYVTLKGGNGIEYKKYCGSDILSDNSHRYVLFPGLSFNDKSHIKPEKMPENSNLANVESDVIEHLESILRNNKKIVKDFLFKKQTYLKENFFGKDLNEGLIKHNILEEILGGGIGRKTFELIESLIYKLRKGLIKKPA